MANIKYTKELLEPVIGVSKCWREACETLGLKGLSGSQTHLKKRADSFGIDYSHFPGNQWNKGRKFGYKTPIKNLLVKNGTNNSHWLKKRLITEGIKQYVCEECGLSKWDGKAIPLELHHKNSIHNDNRLNNLKILCPNCHRLQ